MGPRGGSRRPSRSDSRGRRTRSCARSRASADSAGSARGDLSGEKLLHGSKGRFVGRCVIGNLGASLNARVVEIEFLASRYIYQLAAVDLAHRALPAPVHSQTYAVRKNFKPLT